MAVADMWGKFFFISVTLKGGTQIELASVVDPTSLKVDPGDVPGESVVNSAGGHMWKQDAEEDGELSFDMMGNIDISSSAASGGLFQAFVGGTYSTSDTRSSDTSWAAGDDRTRDRFMVAVLQTDDAAALTAAGTTAASTNSKRFHVKGARIVSLKESWGDGTNKVSTTFKFPPYIKSGATKTYRYDSSATSLAAITYTSGDAI